MNINSYLSQRNAIIRSVELPEAFIDNDLVNGQFTLTSAALTNFLPAIDHSRHASIFRDLLIHKKLSLFDQDQPLALRMLTTENFSGDIQRLLRQHPCVICTFHLGSYRLINLFLHQLKIPFTLVTARELIESEGTNLAERFARLDTARQLQTLRIIDASHPASGLQMLRELRSGRSLVLYIDGNSGAGAEAMRNDNCCRVDLLGQQILARKGIAYLAHRAGVPLIPVASYCPGYTDIRLRFFEPVFPVHQADPLQAAIETTSHLYNEVAPFIRQYPGQWEAWTYIHKTANIINIKQPVKEPSCIRQKTRFNFARFGLIRMGKKHFLFGKNTYASYQIDETLFNHLKTVLLTQQVSGDIKKCQIDELEKEGVLI